ncbi:MAG: Tfp pilus assembly protein FimT/FimU [Actinomycetota bacterium]
MKSLLRSPHGGRDLARAERGFTILELVSVIALLSVILTLGAAGFRHYWLLHSLKSAQGDVATQLRQIQARVASESHPYIYGARFTPGSSNWSLLKYDQGVDRLSTSDDGCAVDGEVRRLAGVVALGAPDSGFTSAPGVDVSKCGGAHASDLFVMFYAKGTATAGKVTLRSTALDRTKKVEVSGLTARVEAP